MIEKPRLKSFLTVFPLSDNTWGLRGGSEEQWRIKLGDENSVRAFGALLPFLNGNHKVGEILEKTTAQGFSRAAVEKLLEHLEASSFIEDSDSSGLSVADQDRFSNQLTFFSRFTSEGGAKYQSRLLNSCIGVVNDGQFSRSVQRHLSLAGFGQIVVLNDGDGVPGRYTDPIASPARHSSTLRLLRLDRKSIWPADDMEYLPEVFVVPQETHDPQLLEAMDTFSKKHNVPWMLLRALDPPEGWVGPLFVPGDTASYLSLEARLRGNIHFFDEYVAFDNYLRANDAQSAACGGLHTFFDMLSGIAVTEIIKYVAGIGIPTLAGKFLTINMLTWDTEIHEVLRVPRLEMDSSSHPRVFPWKEIPYGDKKTRRA
jgi:hypothetical protein